MTEKSVVLITGASRGIGRSVALEFAKQGAHVLINFSSNEAKAQEVAEECAKLGGSGEPIGFNVGASEEVSAAVQAIKTNHGKIDTLVNNAGISRDGLFVRFSDEDWKTTLGVNLDGTFYVSREVAKIMMKARKGSIINMSSVVGEMGNAGQAAYSASKAGLIGLTKTLARELAARNITVNAITPGFIETDMTGSLDEKVREEHLNGIPLGRYGKPEEVAYLTRFLASDEARYITGQVIGINGGLYC
ncbi:MAG: 3-oxoacyl-[acyl-carrier-protein] reductase [Bdellovibrionales bacterium]|nr:3-oxoacyl-[acyl-carrier-protein] reductase [Bdellovibrionales bacterium]